MMFGKMNQLSFWCALKTKQKLLKLVSEIWSAGKGGMPPTMQHWLQVLAMANLNAMLGMPEHDGSKE